MVAEPEPAFTSNGGILLDFLPKRDGPNFHENVFLIPDLADISLVSASLLLITTINLNMYENGTKATAAVHKFPYEVPTCGDILR